MKHDPWYRTLLVRWAAVVGRRHALQAIAVRHDYSHDHDHERTHSCDVMRNIAGMNHKHDHTEDTDV